MNSKHQTIAKKTQNKQNPPKNQTKKLSLAACLIKLLSQSCCRFCSAVLQPGAGLGNMVGRQVPIVQGLFKDSIAMPSQALQGVLSEEEALMLGWRTPWVQVCGFFGLLLSFKSSCVRRKDSQSQKQPGRPQARQNQGLFTERNQVTQPPTPL